VTDFVKIVGVRLI